MLAARATRQLAPPLAARGLAAAGGGGKGKGKGKGKRAPQEGPPVLELRGVSKTFADQRRLFDDLSLTFLRGAKIGVIGANGSGKSSLLKVISGDDPDVDGEVWRAEGLAVKYLAQEPVLDESVSVRDNVMGGLREQVDLLAAFNDVSMRMGTAEPDEFDALLDEQAQLQARIDELHCWDMGHLADTAMRALNVPPGDAAVGPLSGGERRRVALCQLLLEQPDFLLLDEPTNHLDAGSVAWLEAHLQQFQGSVVLITHDRYFLDNVVDWILELDRGQAIPFKGNYSAWLEHRQTRFNMEKARERSRARQMQRELEWLRAGSHARDKARSREVDKLRAEAAEGGGALGRVEAGNIVIPPGPRLGDKVVEVEGVTVTVQDEDGDGDGEGTRTLVRDLSFRLNRGDVLGVVGANGTGKSTLLSVIAGLRAPDAGSVELGETVDLGLVSQSRAELDPDKTVFEEIAQGAADIEVDGRDVPVRAYTASFNFRGREQEKLVGSLSGGERNRVHMAKVLAEGHNVLLLDEPTNDLDVHTLSNLEQALEAFAGAVVIVSHDRFFLDRICTHTLAFTGEDGGVEFGRGGYSAFTAANGSG